MAHTTGLAQRAASGMAVLQLGNHHDGEAFLEVVQALGPLQNPDSN